eukprot:TRINITY_DN32481_c0_g1_i1.p1 TRINITY_DN32481_c0_g1~~TRINITY_DN32481_c0_g1_i1.p1  ORF type:complete len:452 (-),score=74.91 TRINITY_DN32481_c0_g1_i1:44-1399(-)
MAPQLGSNRYAALLSDDDDGSDAQNHEKQNAAIPLTEQTAKTIRMRTKNIAIKETVEAVDEQPIPRKGQKRRRTAIAEATPVEPVEQVASSAFATSSEKYAARAMAPQLRFNRYAALVSDDDVGGDAPNAEDTPAAIRMSEQTANKMKERAKNITHKETVEVVDGQLTPRKGPKKRKRAAATPVEPAQQLAPSASAASGETSAGSAVAPQMGSNRYAALLSDDDDHDDDRNGEQPSGARPDSDQTAREKGCVKKMAKRVGGTDEQLLPTKGQSRKRPTETEAALAEPAQRLASSTSVAKDEAPLPAGSTRTLQGGVTIKVIRAAPEGSAVARHGCEVKLLYEGSLPNKKGLRFDAGEIDFLLGDGTMLKGFATGVVGMHVGERRLIHIPWRLGYGKKGKPPKIPPMSDLDFDASLVFCGVDWGHRISDKRSDMSNKRREAGKRRGKKPKAT